MLYLCRRGQSGAKREVFAFFPSVRRESMKKNVKSSIFRKKTSKFLSSLPFKRQTIDNQWGYNSASKNMEVRKICQWCGKPFIAQKTTTCYCSPQCSKRGYKHRIKERKMELRHIQEMQESRSSLEKQEYFTFSQAARLMGVSSQYIYKLVK